MQLPGTRTGRDNVEAAATLREQLQDGEITVSLDGKAYGVRNGREAVLEFVESIRDGAAAVNVRGSAKTIGDFLKRQALAKNAPARASVLPGKVRSECCWVDVPEISTSLPGDAHFTFKITRVRSSESGAL